MNGWIGVDLDGTLAHYEGWDANGGVGKPVPAMMARVKHWLSQGVEVRIVTARFHVKGQCAIISAWMEKHGLPQLDITASKDLHMIELWDDRAVRVEHNTGRVVGGALSAVPLPQEVFAYPPLRERNNAAKSEATGGVNGAGVGAGIAGAALGCPEGV